MAKDIPARRPRSLLDAARQVDVAMVCLDVLAVRPD
jgi:hypothetical protein